MPFIDIATALINRGFSVIPIEARGKKPLKGWGATRRTRNVGDFAQVPTDCNIGICADENIVILETDDYEGFSAAIRNGTGNEIPATATAFGSSPNRPHFFFRRTEKASNVGNLAVPGLFEARFSNQYVVGAGSAHPSGAVYQWRGNNKLLAIPDWLVGELARLALKQRERTAHEIQKVGGKVAEGSRHYFLMSEGGRLWNGKITEEELTEELRRLNETICDPPKPDVHVLECVRDLMRRDPYDPGPTVLIGSSPPGESRAEETEEWQSLSADELVALEIEERKPVLTENGEVLLYERSINQILAWRGVGKTNFALGLAGALASGGRILDFCAGQPRRVLYLDGELPLAQLKERVRGFVPAGHRGQVQLFSPEMLGKPRTLNIVANGDFDALFRLIERHKIEVVFLDSQSTLMSGDSNEDAFQEARMNMLRQLRWRDLCVVEMHHVGKQGLQRGLSKNDDILDVQMHLKKSPDWEPEDGLEFEIVYEKIRHAAKLESGYLVKLVDGQWTKCLTNATHEVARLLRENPKMSQREIAKKTGISKSKVGRLYHKAIKAGLIDAKIELKIGD
jgi:hypothetical protein